mmetsp:Transcript_19728/g.54797  ORF Transcript_19728/g.54797 Transcript_19728/m.54797 type:complete len:224 (-) Transcript_19728:644-1315(-)
MPGFYTKMDLLCRIWPLQPLVDDIDWLVLLEGPDVSRCKVHQPLPGLNALPADVGSQDDVWELQQRAVGGERLHLLHIQSCAGNHTILQRLHKLCLVYDCSPGGVDDVRRGFHLKELRAANRVSGAVIQRAVDGHKVALREKGVQVHNLGPSEVRRSGSTGRNEDLHPKRQSDRGNCRANGTSAADESQGLASDFKMGQAAQGPPAEDVPTGELALLLEHGAA